MSFSFNLKAQISDNFLLLYESYDKLNNIEEIIEKVKKSLNFHIKERDFGRLSILPKMMINPFISRWWTKKHGGLNFSYGFKKCFSIIDHIRFFIRKTKCTNNTHRVENVNL